MLTCVGFLNIIYDIKYKMPISLIQVDDLKDISENNLCKCHLHIFQELNKSYVTILFTKLRDKFLKTFGFTAFRQMQIEMLKYNTSQCKVKTPWGSHCRKRTARFARFPLWDRGCWPSPRIQRTQGGTPSQCRTPWWTNMPLSFLFTVNFTE